MAGTVSNHVEQVLSEGPIGAAEAARLLGTFRGGRRTHPSTITRWMLSGIRLADGRNLRLEHIRVSNRLMTSRAAVVRFLAEQQLPTTPPEIDAPRSTTKRRRENDRAEDELNSLGIK